MAKCSKNYNFILRKIIHMVIIISAYNIKWIVYLTVYIEFLLMHLFSITESDGYLFFQWTIIVDSCITFLMCWTTTTSIVITFHVGSGTDRMHACSRLHTPQNLLEKRKRTSLPFNQVVFFSTYFNVLFVNHQHLVSTK